MKDLTNGGRRVLVSKSVVLDDDGIENESKIVGEVCKIHLRTDITVALVRGKEEHDIVLM